MKINKMASRKHTEKHATFEPSSQKVRRVRKLCIFINLVYRILTRTSNALLGTLGCLGRNFIHLGHCSGYILYQKKIFGRSPAFNRHYLGAQLAPNGHLWAPPMMNPLITLGRGLPMAQQLIPLDVTKSITDEYVTAWESMGSRNSEDFVAYGSTGVGDLYEFTICSCSRRCLSIVVMIQYNVG